MTDKVCLGVLNQIWSRWGFNEIKMGKREKKQINGDRVDVSKFYMKPSKLFNEHYFDKILNLF